MTAYRSQDEALNHALANFKLEKAGGIVEWQSPVPSGCLQWHVTVLLKSAKPDGLIGNASAQGGAGCDESVANHKPQLRGPAGVDGVRGRRAGVEGMRGCPRLTGRWPQESPKWPGHAEPGAIAG